MDELYPRPKNGLAPHALNFGTEQRERERESVCVCVFVCVWERERKSVWVCDRRVWEWVSVESVASSISNLRP